MTKLERWLNSGAPPEMAEMLRAARAEQPHGRVLRQTLTALGVGAGVGASVVSTAEAAGVAKAVVPKLGALALAVKWGSIGLIGGTLGLGVVVSVQKLTSDDEGLTRPADTAPPQPGAGARVRPAGARTAPEDVSPAPAEDVPPPDARNARAVGPACESEPAVDSRDEASPNVASFDPVEPEQSALTELPAAGAAVPPARARGAQSPVPGSRQKDVRFQRELSLVDAARAAIAAHNPARALTLLAERTSEFGSWGYFTPEARYLELEAHRSRGDRVRARAAARAILREDPGSPHTDTARSELEPGQR